MRHPDKRKIAFPFFPLMMIAGMLLLGLAVQLLWNAIVPVVFHASRLGYWQAVGLLVLCRILFGNFRGRQTGCHDKRGAAWRQKWMSMSEEERARFKEKMRQRFNHNKPPQG